MKTWVIIVGILAITTVVCGFSDELRQRNIENIKKCVEEKGGTLDAPSAEALVCTADRYGKLVNEDGEFIRDTMIQAFGNTIRDPAILEKVRGTYTKCHDEADQSGITGRQQALQIATCFLPAGPLLAKT